MTDPKDKIDFTVEYNGEDGTVREFLNGTLNAAIEVRRQLEDKVLAYAAAVELRNLGWTVIAPEDADEGVQ